jgi:hypothetical protein
MFFTPSLESLALEDVYPRREFVTRPVVTLDDAFLAVDLPPSPDESNRALLDRL